jgi:hypothetical protein
MILAAFIILMIPCVAFAEQYTCTYPSYTNGEPVILKISITDNKSIVESASFSETYNILENNKYGIVLSKSFSGVGSESPKQNDIGLSAIVIDKANMKMTRGNIAIGDNFNSLKPGACIK